MYFYVMEKFCDFITSRPYDQNTTLTYVLKANFCPCFPCGSSVSKSLIFFILKMLNIEFAIMMD